MKVRDLLVLVLDQLCTRIRNPSKADILGSSTLADGTCPVGLMLHLLFPRSQTGHIVVRQHDLTTPDGALTTHLWDDRG